MASKKTLTTRMQHPVYTAAALAAKNPVLLKGEVVYEADARKHKVGDGVTAWNALPYAGAAVVTRVTDGLMSAGDKTKLDGMPNNASSDYRSIPFSVMLGAVCSRVEMKIAAGLVIIRTRITFTDKNAVITTPSHSIQSVAVVDTYAMYISQPGIEPGVRIRINGDTRTAGFVFEVPDSILNQEVAIHCAIPVFSCGQASKEEPLNAIQTFLRS